MNKSHKLNKTFILLSYEDLNEKQNLETKLKQLKKIKESLDVLDTEINNFAKKIGSSIEYEYSDINTFEIKFTHLIMGKIV